MFFVDCCLCDDSDIPGSYPIEGAPALWLKVLSQPKCEKIQALKKAFICSIEKSLLEHDYAESQTKKVDYRHFNVFDRCYTCALM